MNINESNIVNLFQEKQKLTETPEETIARFHSKLDEVLDEFQSMSVKDKFDIMESVVEMNKKVFKLYMDMKKRHDFHMNY